MITTTEIEKLSVMYEGDKARDASSKIRGFLFQDYVAIMCLLQDKAEVVCSEYIEDVDVFFSDGTFEIIQAKYYPRTNPSKKEILTDLYYQYIRLQMLESDMKAKPSLYIHHSSAVTVPTTEEMIEYVGVEGELKDAITYPGVDASTMWLRNNVYTKVKKDEQKVELFKEMSSRLSIEEFLAKLNIVQICDIQQYRDNLMNELAMKYPKPDSAWGDDQWKAILLGLAISCIQGRYISDNADFENIKVTVEEFSQYVAEATNASDEQSIMNYLIGITSVAYEEIIEIERLSEIQNAYLYKIFQNTILWLKELTATVDGQYKLIYSLSTAEREVVSDYKTLPLGERIKQVAEIREAFISFLNYLWKIMVNICLDKVAEETEVEENTGLFDPRSYIDTNVDEYVCFNFPDDRGVNHSVFVPSVADRVGKTTKKIVGRMIYTNPRPEKWFYKNNRIKPGKNVFDYNIADVRENLTIVDLGKEAFYVECMDCIGIEEDNWANRVICKECIFSEKCVKEEN